MKSRKIISGILVSAMMVSLIPGFVFADETEEPDPEEVISEEPEPDEEEVTIEDQDEEEVSSSGECGDSATWSYDEETKTLTVSGTGDMYEYRDLTPWDSITFDIEHVVIEEGITSVGFEAFGWCKNLKTVSFPDSLEVIDSYSFYHTALTEIDVPDSVTYIGYCAFCECYELESVNFGNDSQLESIMQSAFFDCRSLKEFTIVSTLKLIDSTVFNGCNSLTDIYCLAYSDNLKWYGTNNIYNGDAKCHVYYTDLDACVEKYGSDVDVTFVGDLCAVNIFNMDNGSVTASSKIALAGDTVTFTATPASGCFVQEIMVLDENYEAIDFDADSLSFVVPADTVCVTILVAFEKNGWVKIFDDWCYYENGELVTGWKKISNKYYFFNEDGVMQTGWVQSGSKWYYLDESGAMATGWKQIKNKWYYFEASGSMVTGWKQISKKWYYFETSGAMATGWKQISKKWYYFNPAGDMVTGWKKIGTKWYYFQSSGAMQTSDLTYKGKVYHFNSDGSCKNP